MLLALAAFVAADGTIAPKGQLKPAQEAAAQKLEIKILRYGMCADLHDLGDLPIRADTLINTYRDAGGNTASDVLKFSALMYLGDVAQHAGSVAKMCSSVLQNRAQAVSAIRIDWTSLQEILVTNKSHESGFPEKSTTAAMPPARYPVDSAGQCIYPRDFSHVSIKYRARVESFWNRTVNAHRLTQQSIQRDMQDEMRRNFVDRRAALSDQQKQLRERILTDGRSKQLREQATYKQEYEDLIGSLPASDRAPAARAMAMIVTPVDQNCPKGFEVDPQK